MVTLGLTCLGAFTITVDDQPAPPLRTDKVRALLAYLALEARPQRRERLAGLLWPDIGEEYALKNLRNTLHRLRQPLEAVASGFGETLLISDRQTIGLDPAHLTVDVQHFTDLINACATHTHAELAQCSACLARLAQAAELYQGELLAGFSVADAPAFEEWLLLRREALHQQVLLILYDLAVAHETRREWEAAQRYARRFLGLEPWREEAHRLLMRILARDGQRAAALTQYQSCRQVLQAELGIEPDGETTALYEQIRTGIFEKGTGRPAHAVSSASSPAISPSPAYNLPRLLTPLIGRNQEMAEITRLLTTTRLLTLTGAAGSGKTRLALEVATRMQERVVDGVWLVELAGLTDANHVTQTVNAIWGIRETALPPQAALIGYLQTKNLLLILDNCEHLRAACATLVERLLASCPHVQILATSREPFHISGEQLWSLQPLAVPDEQTTLPPDQLLQYDAVRLFVERARQVKADFTLTPQNAPAVSQICRHLDGLPLALELAAARVRALSPQEMAARLHDQLPLLSDGKGTRPAHQQTLRATLDWGYALLNEPEQRLFRQLAVFVGGWTLAAAEAVCAATAATVDLVDLHIQLVDKSLIFLEEQADGMRYRMLATLHQYAFVQLTAAGEVEAVRKRHLAFFMEMAQTATTKLRSAEQAREYAQLEGEHGNLRAALDWALVSGQVIAGLELAGALYYFWHVYGYRQEGLARLQNILAHPEAAAPTLPRVRALLGVGHILCDTGKYAQAQPALTEALTLAQQLGDQTSIARALSYLGAVAGHQGDEPGAHKLLEQSIALARILDDRYSLCTALNLLGQLALRQGAHQEAARFYAESVGLLRALGIQGDLAYVLRQLGHAVLEGGARVHAIALYRESLTLCLAVKGKVGMLANVVAYAWLAVADGDLVAAAQLCGAVEHLQHTLALTLWPAGQVRYDRAVAAVRTSLDTPAVAAAWHAGQSMTLEQAVQFALTLPETTASRPVTDPLETSPHLSKGPADAAPASPPIVTRAQVHDWGDMPAVDFFAGRTTEMAQLKAWLTPSPDPATGGVRLVSIVGIGGMGKTTLAAAAVKAVAPLFEIVIWRSLLNAPPLTELLGNWLQILAHQTLTTFPESFDEQLRLLLDYLRQQRCLLVLDNVESILQAGDNQGRAGEMRPGYEGYAQLLQRVAGSEHQSSLLLTSREQPYVLARQGRPGQEQVPSGRGPVQLLRLAGLTLPAGHAILQSQGLHASSQEAELLVQTYSGNPLALQIVGNTIADFFGGDVAAFQQEEGFLFDGIRAVLDQQFARLSDLEREILVWLAIEREAVTVQTLRSNLVQAPSTAELLGALHALQARSLLEKTSDGLTLQNVIIEYTTEYLVESVCAEFIDKVTRWQGDKVNEVSPVTLSSLNRFALLKAQAKEHVRQSQVRLILQPVAEHLLTKLGRAKLLTKLAAQCKKLDGAPGYAAGNLLNLLLQLQVDVTGYEFSNCTVWQAFLRERTIHNVNFAHSDLSGSVFTYPFGLIYSVAYSPDSSLIAGGSHDGTVFLWRADNGQSVATYQGHTATVYAVAFSPDGKLLASASEDTTICLRDWQSGQIRHVLRDHSGFVNTVAFSRDGSLLASGSDDSRVHLWDVASGRLLHDWFGNEIRTMQVAFGGPSGADDSWLACCGDDGKVQVWEIATGQLVQAMDGLGHVVSLAFSPHPDRSQATLVSTGAEAIVRLWYVDSQGCWSFRDLPKGDEDFNTTLAISPDGSMIATAGGGEAVRLRDIRTGAAVASLPGHRHVYMVAFSPDGQSLVSTSRDRTVRVWNLRTMQVQQMFSGYSAWVSALVFDPRSDLWVATIDGAQIRLWHAQTGHTRHTLLGHHKPIAKVAFSAAGRLLLSGGLDGSVHIWDLHSGLLRNSLTRHTGQIEALASNRSETLFAIAGYDKAVHLWHAPSAAPSQLIGLLEHHDKAIYALAFGGPTGAEETLLAGTGELNIYVWDLATQQVRYVLSAHIIYCESLTFSPDGALLASGGSDHQVCVWDMATGQLRHSLRGHHGSVWGLAFSPDGRLLVSGSGDRQVCIWNVERGSLLRTLHGHNAWLNAITFSPDGRLLATGSVDGAVKLWDVNNLSVTDACLETLYAKGPYAGMNITGVTGISDAQKAALKALGAVEEGQDDSEQQTPTPP